MTAPVSLAELLDPRRAGEIASSRSATAAFDEAGAQLALCASRLREMGADGAAQVQAWCVPGRIEVLGKHTDYAGGRSLLAAVERGIYIVAAAREGGLVAVVDARTGERCTLPIDADLQPPAGWAAYPAVVASRLARNFPGIIGGADLAFASTLPPAAGMSSSSALIIATFLALAGVAGLPEMEVYGARIRNAEVLAEYVAAVESGADFHDLSGGLGVGTQGGSQDHTAILCARPGELVQYAFRPVRFERSLPWPADRIFVIAASGVTAEKAGAARERYNAAAGAMERIAELWRGATKRSDETVGEALESHPAAAERIRGILRTAGAPSSADRAGATMPGGSAESAPGESGPGVRSLRERGDPATRPQLDAGTAGALVARLEQFVEESQVIVPAAGDALAARDLDRFGRLVDRSQQLAEGALGNQVSETVGLVRLARELGADAASAFGAGFGGSVWALVAESESAEFLARWRERYLERFPQHAGVATFFATRPGPPARQLI